MSARTVGGWWFEWVLREEVGESVGVGRMMLPAHHQVTFRWPASGTAADSARVVGLTLFFVCCLHA